MKDTPFIESAEKLQYCIKDLCTLIEKKSDVLQLEKLIPVNFDSSNNPPAPIHYKMLAAYTSLDIEIYTKATRLIQNGDEVMKLRGCKMMVILYPRLSTEQRTTLVASLNAENSSGYERLLSQLIENQERIFEQTYNASADSTVSAARAAASL